MSSSGGGGRRASQLSTFNNPIFHSRNGEPAEDDGGWYDTEMEGQSDGGETSGDESEGSPDDVHAQEVDEEMRRARYLEATHSQEGSQSMAAMAAMGAVSPSITSVPDATRSRDDPWLKPPSNARMGALGPLPEHGYPVQDDQVDIELREEERQQMERMQEENSDESHESSSQPWSQHGKEGKLEKDSQSGQPSPFAHDTQQHQQRQDGVPRDAVAIDMQEASGRVGSGDQGGQGEPSKKKDKDEHSSEAMISKQHAELLAKLPEDQQLVLEFRNICSYAVMGGMGAQAKFNQYLGKLDPLDWNWKAINPFRLSKTVKAKAQAAKRKTQDSGRQPSGQAPGVAGGKAGKRFNKMLPKALRPKQGPGADGGKPVSKNQKAAAKNAAKQILFDISGRVLPGQVLALMGPSGSGKTSLLAVLGGRTPPRIQLEGQILVNGEKCNKATRKRIGFVLQDDVLYETLTVYETLMYAGMLRLPRTMTKAEKSARVEAVMSVLGISRSKDTIIGGFFRRGISGGERKRVSVGHELLINPAILLLDEPTSGLDSTTALHLVNLLRDLASAGRAILTTIHQPSSRLYRQLDQVMLLAEGHPMYYGDALRAADWFEHLGFRLPYGTNLADHILDCAMGEVAYSPEAPGAAAANYTVGPACGAPYMHGGVEVKCLYTTFEKWYEQNPDGFTLGVTDNTRDDAKEEREARLKKAGTKEQDKLHSMLQNVRLLVPPTNNFTGMRISEQLQRPAVSQTPTLSLSVQGSKQLPQQHEQQLVRGGSEGNAGEPGKANGTVDGAQPTLRSRRASIATPKQTEETAARQCLLSNRPKSVDLQWGNRGSKEYTSSVSRLPIVGRLLGARTGSIEEAEATSPDQEAREGGSSSSSGGGPQDLLKVMQTPAPGQQGSTEAQSAECKGVVVHQPGMDSGKAQPPSSAAKAAGGPAKGGGKAAGGEEEEERGPKRAWKKMKNLVQETWNMVGFEFSFKKDDGPPDMGALWPQQTYILWSRALKVRRFESFSGQQLFQLLAVSIIAGLLWWQRGRTDNIEAAFDIQGLLFFQLLFPAFRSLFSALFTFPSEYRLLAKERPSGMYKLSAYYWARVGADLPMELVLPTVFVVIVYWFGGLAHDAGAFFANWATIMLVVTLAQSWGLWLGGICMDPKQAQTVTTVVMLTFLLVGGFYVRDVPVWIGWVKYFSFIYWGNNLVMKIEFGARTFYDYTQPGNPKVEDLQGRLNLSVDPYARRYEEVVVLIAMVIILRYFTYLTLRWKTGASQKSL